MRKYTSSFQWFLSVLLLVSCKTGEDFSEIKEGIREINDQQGMVLGQGALSLFGTPKNVCIDYDDIAIAAIPNTEEGQSTSFNMMLVEDQATLTQTMDLSNTVQLQASIGGLSKVSAKAQFALKREISKEGNSVYLLVSMKVKGRTSRLVNPRLKEEIRKTLEGDLTTDVVEALISKCGDEYLQAVTEGGEFFGIIEIETDSESQKRKITADISGSLMLQSGPKVDSSNKINSEFEKITKGKKVRSWSIQIGGLGEGATGAISVKEMLERAKEMPNLVKNSQSSRILSGYFGDYFTLGIELKNKHLRALKTANSTVEDLSNILGKLRQQKGSISKVLKNPSGYRTVDIGKLETTLSKVELTIRSLLISAKKCKEDYLNCRLPRSIRLISYQEPEPMGAIYSDESLQGLDYDQEPSKLRCFVNGVNGEIEYLITRIQVHYLEKGILRVRLWKRKAYWPIKEAEIFRVSPYEINEFYLNKVKGKTSFSKRGAHFLSKYVFKSPLEGNSKTKLRRCEHY